MFYDRDLFCYFLIYVLWYFIVINIFNKFYRIRLLEFEVLSFNFNDIIIFDVRLRKEL